MLPSTGSIHIKQHWAERWILLLLGGETPPLYQPKWSPALGEDTCWALWSEILRARPSLLLPCSFCNCSPHCSPRSQSRKMVLGVMNSWAFKEPSHSNFFPDSPNPNTQHSLPLLMEAPMSTGPKYKCNVLPSLLNNKGNNCLLCKRLKTL